MSGKCGGCGLINAAGAATCRRCAQPMGGGLAPPPGGYGFQTGPATGFGPTPYTPTGVRDLDTVVDPLDIALRENARNWLFLAAALKAIPVILVTWMVVAADRPLPGESRGLMVLLWILFLLLVTGAVLVGQGKKIGMWVAAPPLLLMMCSFPVGTAIAFFIAKKISNAADAGALT